MGVVSNYFSDETVISSLRGFYDENERYSINFHYWLHTATITKDGILIRVGSRMFLVEEFTGTVIREVK